jgi:nicotinate-nucleotide adenylyltransferase
MHRLVTLRTAVYNGDMKSTAFSETVEFSYIDKLCLQPKQNRVGLLGGTFNPVHNGHISMAYIALYEFLLGEIVFVPLGQPPHKQDEFIAPSEHRLNMLRLATHDEPRFSVDTIEVNRSGFTYTVDTLESLCRMHPQTEYYYIIGADTLYELMGWKNFERVIALTRFICVMRPGVNEAGVREYSQMLNIKYENRIYVAREKGPDISSSLIRRLEADNRLASGLLPDSVAEYILKNRIYSKGD